MIQISEPVDFSRFRDVAALPFCHSERVFERSKDQHWLETSDNLYELRISVEGLVTAAVSRRKPCSEFLDLLDTLGLQAHVQEEYEKGEEPRADWDKVSARYGIHPDAKMRERGKDVDLELRPVEEEVLQAIQLLAGSSNNPLDVGLFAHGFSSNLSVTLRSLAQKGYIAFSEQENAVKLL